MKFTKITFKNFWSKFSRLNLILLVIICLSCTTNNKILKKSKDYYVAAYVWPSCHHDKRFGDMIWPEGSGEWEIIKKGKPLFEGHYQPKVPLWGYESDDDPQVMEKWIDAATDHGVNIFIFDWYWFDEGTFLESSLNNGFLKAKNNKKMQFYVMWANHDVVKNCLNGYKFKDDTSLLWNGAVDMENFKIIVERVITRYFVQPNYFKIEGKPVFSVFSIQNLVEGFGGLQQAREAIDYFREETKKAGFPGLHLQLIGNGTPDDNLLNNIRRLGANSVTKYNWGGPHPEDYIQWGTESMKRRKQWDEALPIPYFPNVSIGWDDSPRYPQKAGKDIVHYNKSPEGFAAFLQKTKVYCDNHNEQPKLITIFSWNEWIEGGYLLPDIKYGFSYLDAVKRVINRQYEYSEQ